MYNYLFWWAFCEQADTCSPQFQAVIFGYVAKKDLPVADLIHKMVSPKTQSHSTSCAVLFLKYYLGGKVGSSELEWLLATALTSKNTLTQDLTSVLTAKQGGLLQ